MHQFEFETLEVGDMRLRAGVRKGTEEGRMPLLVCNGIGANLELILPFARSLESIDIIVFDAPGCGESDTPKYPYRFSHLAEALVGIIDHYGYDKVDVIGVSWGGALAQQITHDFPERVNRLVLAATASGAVMVPGKLPVLLRMASPRRYLQKEYMYTIAPLIYGGTFRRNPEKAHEHALKVRSAGGFGYYYQLMAGMGWTSIHWLHKIKQPTLIMAGSDDPIIPLINAKIMSWLIPNARLQVVDDGHLFLLTRAKWMGPIIDRFLNEKPIYRQKTEEDEVEMLSARVKELSKVVKVMEAQQQA